MKIIKQKIISGKIKIIQGIAIFVLLGLVVGCNGIFLSERQKVVRASHEAICKEKDIKAIRPFLSKSSLPILDLSTSISNLSQIFIGSTLSDRIAVECHTDEQKFVDEIRVSEERYIVRTRKAGSDSLDETVVILEDGVWKIALLGR